MKIILIKDVKKQGKKGDILEVKDGFATFLINNKEAVAASQINLNKLDKENKEYEENIQNKEKEQEENNKIKECEQIKKQLEKMKITFKVKVGESDKVFGTISPKQIVEELKKKGYNIDKKQVIIDHSLSSLGSHIVNLQLHKKVIAKLNIQLVK